MKKTILIRIADLTDSEAKAAEYYIRTNGVLSRYMTRKKMSAATGLSDAKCKAVMNACCRAGLLQKLYAIYCPKCGALVDKSTMSHPIHVSGYKCPVCRETVNFEKENLGKLYAPCDTVRMAALHNLCLCGNGKMAPEG